MQDTLHQIFNLVDLLLFAAFSTTAWYYIHILKKEAKGNYDRGYHQGRIDAATESYERTLQRRFDELEKD